MNMKFNLGGFNLTANGFDKHLAHFTTRVGEGRVVTTPDTDIPDEHKHDLNLAVDNITVEIEDFDMKAEAEVCKDLLSFAGNMFCACLDYKKSQDKTSVEDLKNMKNEIKKLNKEIKELEEEVEDLTERNRKLAVEKINAQSEVEAIKEKYKVIIPE